MMNTDPQPLKFLYDKYFIFQQRLAWQICIFNQPVKFELGFPDSSSGKESACSAGDQEMQVRSLGQEAPLEKGMAANSSILAWRTPWTEDSVVWQATYSQWGCKESDTTKVVTHTHTHIRSALAFFFSQGSTEAVSFINTYQY